MRRRAVWSRHHRPEAQGYTFLQPDLVQYSTTFPRG